MTINKEKEKQFSIEYLKNRLDYNSETGVFKWKFKNVNQPDDKIFNKLFGGKIIFSKNHNGYLQIKIDKKSFLIHRIAYLFMTGEWPNGQIDHINGDRVDNRWDNLRVVNNEENQKNQKIYSNNTSGVIGVSWCETKNKWKVQISGNKKRIYLGLFKNFNEAVRARKNAEVIYGYHENHGR